MTAKGILNAFIFFCIFIPHKLFAVDQEVTFLNDAVRNITDVIVHDVLNPPSASRIYAYSGVAAYEIIQMGSDKYPSYYKKLNGMPMIHAPEDDIHYGFAGVLAMVSTAQLFLPSYTMLDPFIDSLLNYYRNTLPQKQFIASQYWAHYAAMRMMSWADRDGFEQIHNLPRYTVVNSAYAWQPTPPDYADPVEPYWGRLQTFAIDSTLLNKEYSRDEFSIDTGSNFYRHAYEFYLLTSNLDEEKQLTARFWDDNPYTTYYSGHMQYARKKISPAGHWMDITRIAIENSSCDIYKAAQSYAIVSVATADAFIYCWKSKYEQNTIRPETYINQYIDDNWMPFLQTPPFPEYPSGHSVVSNAASQVLTALYGENFRFTDKIETEFGLPERTFDSFENAALEASLSRYYSGIHFSDAVVNGSLMGKDVGNYVIGLLLD